MVCACLNSASTLAVQLDSLATQDFDRPWEVIVVDDGSTDGTPTLARSYADRLPDLRVLLSDPPHHSQAAALNSGARAARGRSILMLDGDDEVAPGYLRAMAAALDEHEVVGARLDDKALNPAWARVRTPMQVHELTILNDYLPVVVGAALGIRRDVLLEVGGFDESGGPLNDMDLSWRLQHAGYRPVLVPDAVLRYRYRTGLRETVRQKRNGAIGDVYLARTYRAHGAPRRGVRTTLGGWRQVLTAILTVHDRRSAMLAADLLGGALGRIQGSWRYRYLYL